MNKALRIFWQRLLIGKRRRIAIFGNYKSGTTAIFYRILKALPPYTATHFEPTEYTPSNARVELAKVILGNRELDYAPFIAFDKTIIIVRDPRDWFISGLLFLPQMRPTIYDNLETMTQIISVLKQKESDPRSVSLQEIFQVFASDTNGVEWIELVNWIKYFHRDHINFEKRLHQPFRLYYENFIDNRVADLESYLELSLPTSFELHPSHDHVPRTRSYGNWRDWFTPADVTFFKPIMQPYMDHYGYTDDWTLNPIPSIDATVSSEYVQSTVAKRLQTKRQEGVIGETHR